MGRHVEWRNAKDFFIPYERERATVKERYGRDDWHYRLLKWVHSHGVQLTLALLLAVRTYLFISQLGTFAPFSLSLYSHPSRN